MMKTLRQFDGTFGMALANGARIMFLIFSAVALIVCLGYQLLVIRYPYSMDYGEAPLVDQAMRLASGQNIYRADISTPPYTISNYPPLYVAMLAVSVKAFGPASTFFVGRLLSALSTWASSLCLALIVYAPTRDRFAALSTGLIFLAFPFVVVWSPLLRIDMVALAFSLAGLCLLAQGDISSRRLVSVSILLVAAIYTRQSYALAAPLAAFVWLLSQNWRQALRFTLLVGGSTLVLFVVFNALTQGGFYFNIVTANVNEFKLDQLLYHWDRFRNAALALLWIGGFSFFLIRRWNPLWALAAPYLIGAVLSAATIGKIGSNVNYLLELCAALSLAAGVVIVWSRKYLLICTLRVALIILLALALGHMTHEMLNEYTADLRDRQAAAPELSKLADLVAETPGPILADEYMGMLTLLGRPLIIQPFEVTQLAWAGKWDQTPLLNSINSKEYSAIIIFDKPWAKERWTKEMFNAIDHSYTLTGVIAGNRVYSSIQPQASAGLLACPGAVWRLPSDGSLGVQPKDGGFDFYGKGNEGKLPVYAVDDGLLTRLPGWVDAVAIQHDDPLHPGKKVWSYYGGMGAPNGIDSYVAQDFPLGTANLPVKAGQLLGYQGSWSGTPQWPMWVHAHFAALNVSALGAFPDKILPENIIDPLPYLGLTLDKNNKLTQPLKCPQP
jgi:hypothetical protein